MSAVTIVWTTCAAACLTIALVQVVIWLKHRDAQEHLIFAILATANAGIAACEMAMMYASTGEEIGRAIRWLHVPAFISMVSIVALIRVYFRTGRAWLGHAAWGVRLVSLVLNFSMSPNLNYRAITGVREVPFLGELVAIPVGQPSLWTAVGQLSILLLVWFVIDAAVGLWRRGGRDAHPRALLMGGAIAVFLLIGAGSAIQMLAGLTERPLIVALGFLPLTAVMGYALSLDTLRAAQLARDLLAAERTLLDRDTHMAIAANAVHLGIWVWDLPERRILMTDTCREVLGFTAANVTQDEFMQRLPGVFEDDPLAVGHTGDVHVLRTEHRLKRADGGVRWIAVHRQTERDGAGQPARHLGVCLDITQLREAERATRELSGRLIRAQEEERRRLARDLHDDLSQRFALLAVEMDLIGQLAGDGEVRTRAGRMNALLREISSDVHGISHQLHPAKLDQLGLEAASRSWCRDLAAQSGLQVEFTSDRVATVMPQDVALCLYRILQESLNNVVRHSGARTARVELRGDAGQVTMVICDSGRGFDQTRRSPTSGIGLLSMQERVRLVDGVMAVRSRLAEGTRVEVTIPLMAKEA